MRLTEISPQQKIRVKRDIKDKLLASGFDTRKSVLRFAVEKIFSICLIGDGADENIGETSIDSSYVPSYLKNKFVAGIIDSNLTPIEVMYLKDLLFGNITREELMAIEQQIQQAMQQQSNAQPKQNQQI